MGNAASVAEAGTRARKLRLPSWCQPEARVVGGDGGGGDGGIGEHSGSTSTQETGQAATRREMRSGVLMWTLPARQRHP